MRPKLTLIVVVSLAGLLAASPAAADITGGGTPNGSQNGRSIEAKVVIDNTENYAHGTGGNKPAPTGNFPDPPYCWFQPWLDPLSASDWADRTWFTPADNGGSVGTVFAQNKKDHYVDGNPYKDWNNGQDGLWWQAAGNYSADMDKASDCLRGIEWDIIWVPTGTQPPPDVMRIDVRGLARVAADSLRVPEAVPQKSPVGVQTVNLPTWVWVDSQQVKEYSVTASIPGTQLWATTIAEPIGLKVDPGASSADVFSDCSVKSAPPPPHPVGNPPCGVIYRRASTSPVHLRASIVWHVRWKGYDGTAGDFGNSEFFGPPQDLTVQEIQAVVGR